LRLAHLRPHFQEGSAAISGVVVARQLTCAHISWRAIRRQHIHLDDIADTQVIKFAQTWNESTAAGRSAPSVLDALVKAYGRANAKLCLRKIERLVARELLQYNASLGCAWPTDQGLERLDDSRPSVRYGHRDG
jgi:hypothetical protein